MSEMTQEDALRLADAACRTSFEGDIGPLLGTGGVHRRVRSRRCNNPGMECEALRELRALHASRQGLLQRRSLIQQALDCPVGESPSHLPPPQPQPTVIRPQRQIQVQVRRRASRTD